MTPYLMSLLQKVAASPTAQRAVEMATRLETRWPALPRGPGGTFPARSAAEKIPLAPIGRGIAGAGAFGTIYPMSSSAPVTALRPGGGSDPSTAALFAQLDRGPDGTPASTPAALFEQLNRAPDGSSASVTSREIPSAVGGMYDEFNQAAPVYSGPPIPPAVQRAVQVARQSAGVPVPPQRPDSLAPQPPSAEAAMAARTNAVRDAWTRYNETGSAADFVRASALMQANMPERQQEADGGSIKAKSAAKPDPVHKALEIIHHLLVHGR